MSWRLKGLCFLAGVFLATGIETARADEGFLCPGNRIVYVKFGDIERMKATDPCIASYFGITLPAAATPSEKTKSSAAALAPAVLQAPADPATPLILRPLSDPDLAARANAPVREAAVRQVPPQAAIGTDFRNVRVLNPQQAQSAIFVHAR